MANLEAITAAVAAIEGNTANVERALGILNATNQELTNTVAELEAGVAVTQEQIDALTSRLAAADAALDAIAPEAPNAPNEPTE